jgi:hypothetical protein
VNNFAGLLTRSKVNIAGALSSYLVRIVEEVGARGRGSVSGKLCDPCTGLYEKSPSVAGGGRGDLDLFVTQPVLQGTGLVCNTTCIARNGSCL